MKIRLYSCMVVLVVSTAAYAITSNKSSNFVADAMANIITDMVDGAREKGKALSFAEMSELIGVMLLHATHKIVNAIYSDHGTARSLTFEEDPVYQVVVSLWSNRFAKAIEGLNPLGGFALLDPQVILQRVIGLIETESAGIYQTASEAYEFASKDIADDKAIYDKAVKEDLRKNVVVPS